MASLKCQTTKDNFIAIAVAKDVQGLKELIKADWNVNKQYEGRFPLTSSMMPPSNSSYFYPIHAVVNLGWMEGVEMLLQAKADLEKFDYQHVGKREWCYTPLMWAAKNDSNDILKALIEGGSSVNAQDPITQQSALLLSALNASEKAVQLLLGKGAKVDVVSCDHGQTPSTPLLAAAQTFYFPMFADEEEEVVRIRESALKVVSLLLDHNCDVTLHHKTTEQEDDQSVFVASRCKDPRVLELLLKNGKCDLNSKDKRGRTPFGEAVKEGSMANVKLMLSKGIKAPNSIQTGWDKEDFRNPITVALENNYFQLVKVLADNGCVLDEEATVVLKEKCFNLENNDLSKAKKMKLNDAKTDSDDDDDDVVDDEDDDDDCVIIDDGEDDDYDDNFDDYNLTEDDKSVLSGLRDTLLNTELPRKIPIATVVKE